MGGSIRYWNQLVNGTASEEGDLTTLNWSEGWTADSVLSALTIASNQSRTGGLIDQSGKAETAIAISVNLPVAGLNIAGVTFDPRQIYIAFLRDIDGTNFETPPNLGDQGSPNPAVTLASALPAQPSTTFNRVFTVPSEFAPGFRVWVSSLNPGGQFTINVATKQA